MRIAKAAARIPELVFWLERLQSTYDWKGNQWSVPINFQVGQVFKIGPQLIQLAVGARYWAVAPGNGPEGWGYRVQLTFLFPK